MKYAIIISIVAVIGIVIWMSLRSRRSSPLADDLPLPEAGTTYPHFVFAKMLDTVKPLERGKKYEDPLDALLKAQHIGEVTGGGTMLNKDNSIQFIGVDIELANLGDALQVARKKLIELGAPKGSVFEFRQDGKKVVLPIYDN